MMIDKLFTRRDVVKRFFHYGMLLILALVTGILFYKKRVNLRSNACYANNPCTNCTLFAQCDKPEALTFKK